MNPRRNQYQLITVGLPDCSYIIPQSSEKCKPFFKKFQFLYLIQDIVWQLLLSIYIVAKRISSCTAAIPYKHENLKYSVQTHVSLTVGFKVQVGVKVYLELCNIKFLAFTEQAKNFFPARTFVKLRKMTPNEVIFLVLAETYFPGPLPAKYLRHERA